MHLGVVALVGLDEELRLGLLEGVDLVGDVVVRLVGSRPLHRVDVVRRDRRSAVLGLAHRDDVGPVVVQRHEVVLGGVPGVLPLDGLRVPLAPRVVGAADVDLGHRAVAVGLGVVVAAVAVLVAEERRREHDVRSGARDLDVPEHATGRHGQGADALDARLIEGREVGVVLRELVGALAVVGDDLLAHVLGVDERTLGAEAVRAVPRVGDGQRLEDVALGGVDVAPGDLGTRVVLDGLLRRGRVQRALLGQAEVVRGRSSRAQRDLLDHDLGRPVRSGLAAPEVAGGGQAGELGVLGVHVDVAHGVVGDRLARAQRGRHGTLDGGPAASGQRVLRGVAHVLRDRVGALARALARGVEDDHVGEGVVGSGKRRRRHVRWVGGLVPLVRDDLVVRERGGRRQRDEVHHDGTTHGGEERVSGTRPGEVGGHWELSVGSRALSR